VIHALNRCCVGLLVHTDNDTPEHLMHGEMGCAILQFRNGTVLSVSTLGLDVRDC
jgi:hypothetical protein